MKHRKTVNEKKQLVLELQQQVLEKSQERKVTLLKKNKNNISSDTQTSFGKESVSGLIQTRHGK